MSTIRLAACQLNPTVGDLTGNAEKIIKSLKHCEEMGVDVAVFPELALTGYPPEDLALKPGFIAKSNEVATYVASRTEKTVAIFGYIEPNINLNGENIKEDSPIETSKSEIHSVIDNRGFNSAAVAVDGEIFGIYRKKELPNYSVFDEKRVFLPSNSLVKLYLIGGVNMGVAICEDAWTPGLLSSVYDDSADLIIVINASPYSTGKLNQRIDVIKQRTEETRKPIFYVNMVGGQDELVFDGGSFLIEADGQLKFKAPQFSEGNFIFDFELNEKITRPEKKSSIATTSISLRPLVKPGTVLPVLTPNMDPLEEIYSALILGTKDYVQKNNFKGVVIGLSGGIDSSLVAAIAADALGSQNVTGIAMPSKYNADSSLTDAEELASLLKIEFKVIPIESVRKNFEQLFKKTTKESLVGLAAENIQSRIRGVILMAYSNQNSSLVLTTSNKSELAVGYSTLYGDTAGGFSVIKDILKTQVYELAKWRNLKTYVIHENVLNKAPSAELREDQRDDQSLPPYEILDECLVELIDHDHIISEISSEHLDEETVHKIANMVDVAEYKRRQSPPGIKISSKSFGKDRRVPITNKFRN